jgi:hypothetical protein
MHIPASELHTYELDQHEIESAPTITFKQFRALAKRREWSEAWLVEQCQGHIDNTVDTIRRVLKAGDPDTVIPYQPLINLYLTRR